MNMAQTVARSVYITPELIRRAPKVTDYLDEKLALEDIAAQIVDHPADVLPKLVDRAMQVTGAASAGISVLEAQEGTAGIFRWRYLRGELTRFEGGTTPRERSPCGVCLDRMEPTLARRPERLYPWMADAGVCFAEVLLAPLSMANELGTLWLISDEEGHFDSGHARAVEELASFAGIALTMVQDKQRLEDAVRRQEMLTDEMSHRVNNLFSIVDAMIRVSKRSAATAEDMAAVLSGRLHALAAAHALVRRGFSRGPGKPLPLGASLKGVIDAILKPYEADDGRLVVAGPDIGLGRQAATRIALVLHELATNAAKYGGLAREKGRVSVSWKQEGSTLALQWRETGGPAITARPAQEGFGGVLIRDTIRLLGGTITLDWREQGLAVDLALPLAELAR